MPGSSPGMTKKSAQHKISRRAEARERCLPSGLARGRDAGRRTIARLFWWATFRRPACGDVFAALPRRLTSVSARASERSRSDETWPFQTPGGRGSEPLRLLRCACARCEGNRGFRPRLPRAASGAASLIPRYRRSAARVLTDEGWTHCNAAARAGDKLPQIRHSGASRNLETATDVAASGPRLSPG